MSLLAAPKPHFYIYVLFKMVVWYINFKGYCFGQDLIKLVLLRSFMVNIA